MTIKFELPSDDSSALYHIGTALRNIAIDMDPSREVTEPTVKKTVTESVGEVTRTVTTEPVDTRPIAQIDQDDSDREDALIEEALSAVADGLRKPVPELKGDIENAPQEVIDDKIDGDGVPWDQRIHSRGKTRNADNTWRVSRCPKDKTKDQWESYVEEVKAELLALMSVPVVTQEDVTPPVVEDVTPPVVEDVTPPVVEDVTPPVVEDVTPPVVEPSAAAKAFDAAVIPPVDSDAPKTFGDLMKFITKNNKKLTTETVKQVLVDNGIAAVPLLASRPDLIPQVHSALVAKL